MGGPYGEGGGLFCGPNKEDKIEESIDPDFLF